MNFENVIHKASRYLKRNSPTILSGMAVVGVVATAVTAVRATPKAISILNKEKYEEKTEKLPPLQVVKLAWKPYIPSILIGTATITCIVGSTVLNRRQQAALSSAYLFLEQSYKEYKNKVKALFGEDADDKITSSITKDKYAESDRIPVFDGEKCTFYEEHYGKFFERTMLEVRDAEYNLNKKLVKEGQVCLNDFMELLGLPSVKYGDILGWSQEQGFDFYNYTWIEFDHVLIKTGDDMECYEIKTPFAPHYDFDVPWDKEYEQDKARYDWSMATN